MLSISPAQLFFYVTGRRMVCTSTVHPREARVCTHSTTTVLMERRWPLEQRWNSATVFIICHHYLLFPSNESKACPRARVTNLFGIKFISRVSCNIPREHLGSNTNARTHVMVASTRRYLRLPPLFACCLKSSSTHALYEWSRDSDRCRTAH